MKVLAGGRRRRLNAPSLIFCCQLCLPECEPPEVVEVGGVGEEDHAAVVPAEPSPVQVILHTVPCFGYQPMTRWIMEKNKDEF